MNKPVSRVRRTPLQNRSVLGVRGKEPGFSYRIVNDIGDRIESFKARGYEIVEDQTVQIGDRRVATPTKEGTPVQVSVGGGTKGYLMRIKDEWYKEDQVAKEAELQELEKSMKPASSDYGSIKLDRDKQEHNGETF